ALDNARLWFADKAGELSGISHDSPSGPYSVADAMRDYLAWYADHKKALRQTTVVANAHILPALGEIQVERLTTADIQAWRTALAKAPARVRSARGQKAPAHRKPNADAVEGKRQRRATANRLLTVLKAALNYAWRAGKVPSDDQWRKVRPFHNVE